MFDIVMTVGFLLLTVAMAAGVLLLYDLVTLKRHVAPADRQAAIDIRSQTNHRRWLWVMFAMAIIAMFMHAFGVGNFALSQRILYFALAAAFVLRFAFSSARKAK